MKLVSKFHRPSPSSLGGVREKPPSGIKSYSFIDCRDYISVGQNNVCKFVIELLRDNAAQTQKPISILTPHYVRVTLSIFGSDSWIPL